MTAAVALSACAAPAAAPAGGAAAAPAKTNQDINFLVRTDIRKAYAADEAVKAWSKDQAAKVIVDEPAGDVTAKIQAAQAADELVWDGFAVIEGPWAIKQWVDRHLIQP